MFGTTYKYELNTEKHTVKLAPTKGSIAKAFLPSLIGFALLAAWGAVANSRAESSLEQYLADPDVNTVDND